MWVSKNGRHHSLILVQSLLKLLTHVWNNHTADNHKVANEYSSKDATDSLNSFKMKAFDSTNWMTLVFHICRVVSCNVIEP